MKKTHGKRHPIFEKIQATKMKNKNFAMSKKKELFLFVFFRIFAPTKQIIFLQNK